MKVFMIVSRSCARIAMGIIASLALSAWPAAAQDIMTRAKTLYESADYDQALTVLDQLKTDPSAVAAPDVAAYRVFCLLALGRSTEAHDNIAAILKQDPRYQPSETEASPRIRAVFQDVRQQLLPQLFQERYDAAKATFGRKEFKSAADQFKTLLSLLDDPAVAGEDSRRDLRLLISGFYDVAQASLGTQAPAASPPAAAVSSPPSGGAPGRGSSAGSQPAAAAGALPAARAAAPLVYTINDADVTPPVVVSKVLPPWQPNTTALAREFVGLLSVVVNEAGDVVDAKIERRVHPLYDARLVAAAHDWKFRPALKNGQPVPFRTLIEVKLVY
jgi:hypothetical protein